MVRARKQSSPETRSRGRWIALTLVGVSLAASAGVVWVLRGRMPAGKRPARASDQAAIEAAEKFLNHWSRFEYGEALLVSTGEARERVLLAMEKELSLDDAEMRTAASLRAEVENVRLEVRVHEVEERENERVLWVTAYARDGDEVFERDQTFRLKNVDGWKVAQWNTGTRPEDKRR